MSSLKALKEGVCTGRDKSEHYPTKPTTKKLSLIWANQWPFSCIYYTKYEANWKMISSGQTCGGCGGCGWGNYSIVCHGFVGYRLLRNCGHRRTLNTMTPTSNCCTLFYQKTWLRIKFFDKFYFRYCQSSIRKATVVILLRFARLPPTFEVKRCRKLAENNVL